MLVIETKNIVNKKSPMLEKKIEIKADPKEVAQLLFELDNLQVAQVFSEWKKLFDSNYEERHKNKLPIFIFDLNHFMMHVVDHLDDDAKDFIRTTYYSMVYSLISNSLNDKFLKSPFV